MITVEKVIKILENEKLIKIKECDNNTQIEFISYDSRSIKPNTMFFCKGEHYKPEYLDQAISKGATIYISEEKYDVDLQYIIVSDIQKAMAVIALEFYDYPFRDLETIGITGTKGKTTVSCFIKNILDEYTNSKTALISTIKYYTGTTDELAHNTTPEAIELERLFNETKQNGIKYLTMEVSSQGYKRDRVYGVEFKNAIFLNIGEDHISNAEHPNFEDYLQCKIQLVKNSRRIVINKNTDYFDVIFSECKGKEVITYGTDDTADYYYENVEKTESGFKFDAVSKVDNYRQNFEINILGRFNIENALAAITILKKIGIDDESIKRGLLKTSVNGRMNIFEKNGITVIVDYAHNALSYKTLYESIKLDFPNRRIVSVGGSHGSKSYNRRKAFAEFVAGNSDYVYLTALDPQDEKVEDICKDIMLYIEDKEKCETIPDRKTAVETAIQNAKPGDVVVLVGKGEEDYQKVHGGLEKYESDIAIAKRMLKI